jgi:superfamily II DNA or RNA helicase
MTFAYRSLDLLAQLTFFFDAKAVREGRAFANRGAATLLRTRRTAEEIFVQARVDDDSETAHKVEIGLDLDDTGAIFNVFNSCSCPIGEDCKHVVAALITLSRTPEDSESGSNDAARDASGPISAPSRMAGLLGLNESLRPLPVPAQHSAPQAAPLTPAFTTSPLLPEARPKTAVYGWLDAVGVATPLVPRQGPSRTYRDATPEYQLSYLLTWRNGMRLSVARCRVLKSGALGKAVTFRPAALDLASTPPRSGPVSADDIPALRVFRSLQNAFPQALGADDVILEGELGALLLRHALATGRLYAANKMAAALIRGEPLDMEAHWRIDASGTQRLEYFNSQNTLPIPTQPPSYLDQDAGTIGEMRTTWPPELLARLIEAPALASTYTQAERKPLTALAQFFGIELPVPLMPDIYRPGPPKARVVLRMGRFRHQMSSTLIDDYPVAELHFDYSRGLHATANPSPAALVQEKIDGEWIRWERDLDGEADYQRLLSAEGLEGFRLRLGNYVRVDPGGDCLMPLRNNASGWMYFLEEGVVRLDEQGVAVVIDSDFPYRVEQAEDWFVDVEESTTASDWFDLDLGVTINGERVSLVPSLLQLMRQQPVLLTTLRALTDTQTYPVALDEGRVIPIPAGRLKAWLLPLLEFIDADRPRLSRHQAGMLSGLIEPATQWLGSEALRQLAQNLKDFSGIAECLPAPGFTATLRPYQQAGLNWLQFLREFKLAGILADDMGLGKTVQALAHLHLEKVSGRANRPSLVVATTSLMSNWRQEAAKFAPELRVLTLHGKDRATLFDEIDHADIVLTTYPLLVRDREVLLEREYHYLVMDEAQFIKNPKAQSHQVARALRARHRLSLTGTPLENHLGELWAQFDFLMPGFLGAQKRFGKLFRLPIERYDDIDTRIRLADRVRPFLLRRTKEDVLTDLPPRTEIVRWVEIEGGQRDLYESLRAAFDLKLRAALEVQGIGRTQIIILDALLKLRQVCCDPRLVKLPSAEALVKSGAAGSAKLDALLEMLEELLDEGRRILLFSQFTSMFALIEPELEKRRINYSKLTGQTVDRGEQINRFQEGHVPLFLISLKAGGTGLNLTAADTVIHYDPWWNPAVEEQATARAHRIGQEKPVFVYKLMTQGTVEEKILALQDRKRGLADQLMKQKSAGAESGGHLLTAADLDVLFQPLG